MEVNCKPLQDILGFLKVMGADSATIVPSSNGWEFYSRDTTGCMMVSALLRKEAFPSGYDEWEPFATELEYLKDNTAIVMTGQSLRNAHRPLLCFQRKTKVRKAA